MNTSLWIAQIRGVLRLELQKNLLSGRAVPTYLLALLPLGGAVIFIALGILLGVEPEFEGVAGAVPLFGGLYLFTLGFLYFGCVWVFMNLFRGEIMDRSLHYYFLTPIRREVLVAGKFFSGWVSTTVLFTGSTVVFFLLIHGYLIGSGFPDFLFGPGFGQLLAYAGVTAMAVLGYGALFLVFGLFFRNPLVPAVMVFLWEGINPFLPALLKKLSVIFYLQSMLPISPVQGALAVVAEPVPTWMAVPGLIAFTVLTLVAAGLRIRTMEISYASD